MSLAVVLSLLLASPARVQSTCGSEGTGSEVTVRLRQPTTAGNLLVVGITHSHVGRTLRVTSVTNAVDAGLLELQDNGSIGGSHDNRLFMVLARGGSESIRATLNRAPAGAAVLTVFVAEYTPATYLRSAATGGGDGVVQVGPLVLTDTQFAAGSVVIEQGSVVDLGRLDGGVTVVEICAGDALVDLVDAGSGRFGSAIAATSLQWNLVLAVFDERPDGGAAPPPDAGTPGGADAGEGDAGPATDAGPPPGAGEDLPSQRLRVGCGCDSALPPVGLPLLLLVLGGTKPRLPYRQPKVGKKKAPNPT